MSFAFMSVFFQWSCTSNYPNLLNYIITNERNPKLFCFSITDIEVTKILTANIIKTPSL